MSNPMMQVNLFVRDVEGSVRFYRDVLGFQFQGFWDPVSKTASQDWRGPGGPEYAELRVGAARIGLMPAPDKSQPSGRVEMALHVDDARQDHARIKAAGAAPTELAQQAWGATAFFVTDPDGVKWQLVQMTKPC
jgi:catechol 2,3-dioxygenase-like lactoylglutathione lyase family enzyme